MRASLHAGMAWFCVDFLQATTAVVCLCETVLSCSELLFCSGHSWPLILTIFHSHHLGWSLSPSKRKWYKWDICIWPLHNHRISALGPVFVFTTIHRIKKLLWWNLRAALMMSREIKIFSEVWYVHFAKYSGWFSLRLGSSLTMGSYPDLPGIDFCYGVDLTSNQKIAGYPYNLCITRLFHQSCPKDSPKYCHCSWLPTQLNG